MLRYVTLSYVINLFLLSTKHQQLRNLTILEDLQRICEDYFDRMYECESQKYDMEFECRKKDYEVDASQSQVSPVTIKKT